MKVENYLQILGITGPSEKNDKKYYWNDATVEVAPLSANSYWHLENTGLICEWDYE